MANLHLRDVDEVLVRKLHQRAKANGRSAAEEHRLILRQALTGGASEDFAQLAARIRALSRVPPGAKLAEEEIREAREERGRDLDR